MQSESLQLYRPSVYLAATPTTPGPRGTPPRPILRNISRDAEPRRRAVASRSSLHLTDSVALLLSSACSQWLISIHKLCDLETSPDNLPHSRAGAGAIPLIHIQIVVARVASLATAAQRDWWSKAMEFLFKPRRNRITNCF